VVVPQQAELLHRHRPDLPAPPRRALKSATDCPPPPRPAQQVSPYLTTPHLTTLTLRIGRRAGRAHLLDRAGRRGALPVPHAIQQRLHLCGVGCCRMRGRWTPVGGVLHPHHLHRRNPISPISYKMRRGWFPTCYPACLGLSHTSHKCVFVSYRIAGGIGGRDGRENLVRDADHALGRIERVTAHHPLPGLPRAACSQRDETCPVSTGGGTRRVQLVREEGRDVSS